MRSKAPALATAAMVVAVLGAAGTLAPVLTRIVIPQALWLASPYLALGLMGLLSRKSVAAASVTLLGAGFLALAGVYAFLVEERTRAINFVPLFLWDGCAILLLVLLCRRLLWPRR